MNVRSQLDRSRWSAWSWNHSGICRGQSAVALRWRPLTWWPALQRYPRRCLRERSLVTTCTRMHHETRSWLLFSLHLTQPDRLDQSRPTVRYGTGVHPLPVYISCHRTARRTASGRLALLLHVGHYFICVMQVIQMNTFGIISRHHPSTSGITAAALSITNLHNYTFPNVCCPAEHAPKKSKFCQNRMVIVWLDYHWP